MSIQHLTASLTLPRARGWRVDGDTYSLKRLLYDGNFVRTVAVG